MAMKRTMTAALLLVAAPVAAETVAVSAAHMVDVVGGRMIDNPVVVITNGRIVAAGAGIAVPADARRIDLGGLTLLPGLIDMHVHLTSDPTIRGYKRLDYTDSFWTVVGVVNAKRTLDAGFTTVRNVGSGASTMSR